MTITWHLEKRKLSELTDHPRNPRKLSKDDARQLKESLEKFGVIDKPVITTNNMIIGGHQRKQILKKLAIKEVECWVPDRELTDKEIDELNIRLNKNQGKWYFDKLANEWEITDLLDWGFSLDEFGMGGSAVDEGAHEELDSETLEPGKDEDAKTQLGDIYELGKHKVICGSAIDVEVYEKLANEILIDLIITDPPYNVDYTGKTKDKLKIDNDSMDDGDFYSFLKDSYVNMYSVCKFGASIYVFHADMEGINFRKAFKDAGFKLSQCLVWVKNSLVMGRQDYHWKHEPVLYGWKEGEAHTWCSDRTQTTCLEFDRPARSEEHPTMKPVELISYLMRNSSKGGDYILDPFLGSGTTLIAAEQLGRQCFGIEISPAYCDIIVNRWIKYMQKNNRSYTIKRNGEQIDWEASDAKAQTR